MSLPVLPVNLDPSIIYPAPPPQPTPPPVATPLSAQIMEAVKNEPNKAALAIISGTVLACYAFTSRKEIIPVLKQAPQAIKWLYQQRPYLLAAGSFSLGGAVSSLLRAPATQSPSTKKKYDGIDLLDPDRNLTLKALHGQLQPVPGREEVIDKLYRALICADKPNAILVGPPGVGKTALVEGLAAKLATIPQDQLPEKIRNAQIIEIKTTEFASGASIYGQFEKRMEQFAKDVENSPNLIIFIDEIHSLTKVGLHGFKAIDSLKPLMARGKAHIIGATTNEEFAHIEEDGAFNRRLRRIDVAEPTNHELQAMVTFATQRYATFHQTKYARAAVDAAIEASRALPGKYPDKALSLLDSAGAQANVAHPNDPQARLVTAEAIRNPNANHIIGAGEDVDLS